MRTILESKGYRTRIDYDADGKCFVYRREADPLVNARDLLADDPKQEMSSPSNKKNCRADST